MVKILFGDIHKKQLRKQLDPPKLDKKKYEDTNYLISLLEKLAEPTDNIRVRLVRDFPFPAYRMTILRKKNGHTITKKNGDTIKMKPGWYVHATYFAEKFIDGFVFTPEIENVGNI